MLFDDRRLSAIRAKYEQGAHSLFSPSSSHAWTVCSAYILLNALQEDEGSPEAAYGTVGHSVAEEWLISGKAPKHLIGRHEIVYAGWWGYAVEITHEMFEYVRQHVDRCILLPGKHMTEQRVDFSRLTPIPNQGGTLDFAAIDGDTVHVVDLKLGKGVRVYAERNTQAMMYALGLVYKHDVAFGGTHNFKTFRLVINQPRLDHFDEWECSRDDLMVFAGWVSERAKAAWQVDAPRTPDPKACQFCKVKQTCAANAKMQLRLMADQTEAAFGDVGVAEIAKFKTELLDESFAIEAVDPLALTTENLERLRPFKRMVEGWWKTADHELLRRGLAGAPLTRYKVVEGKSNRRFANPTEAAQLLIEQGCKPGEVIEKVIVSPAEAEKLLVKAGHRKKDLPDLLDGIVRKPPGKPTLAPISDRRPALEDASAIAFGGGDDSSDEDEDY
jgi:hypothetical protein